MDWINILKVKQIVTPTTDINVKKIPKKKKGRDCCKEAKDKYKIKQMGSVERYDKSWSEHPNFLYRFAGAPCEEFRENLKETRSYEKGGWVADIIREWEECESV
jgi:hypothetical protein